MISLAKYRNAFLFTLVLMTMTNCKSGIDKDDLKRGQEVYIANCISCHGPDGRGIRGLYPSLIKHSISTNYTQRVELLIRNGSPIENSMPPIDLTDQEITDVINYIQNSWGNEAPIVINRTLSDMN